MSAARSRGPVEPPFGCSPYPFRSGEPVDRTKLQAAADAAYEAAANLSKALVMDGVSDWRRDDCLEAGAKMLGEAQSALAGCQAPPPVPPASSSLFALACEMFSPPPDLDPTVPRQAQSLERAA